MSKFTRTPFLIKSSLCLGFLLLFMSMDINNQAGAPAAKTGSPGDGANCTGCHSGTAQTVSSLITSDIPASGYVPGNIYTITASIADPTSVKFGMQISPQKTSGTKVGTMNITDATRTQLISAGKYITHKTAGTAATGNANTWSFAWTAPAAGTGNFTFYGAFVVANSSNSTAGDAVKLSTLAVNEDLTSAIDEKADVNTIRFYPNPAENFLSADIEIKNKCILSIFSVDGKLVKEFYFAEDGSKKIMADISSLSTGLYVAELDNNGVKRISKFFKN